MTALEILNQYNLRRTASRTAILDIFDQNPQTALSENDLEKAMQGSCDRATIYRTLKTFEEKGILHKVIDENNLVKYARCCQSQCSTHDHNHNHVHFKCSQCGITICMDDLDVKPVTMPEGFSVQEINYLVIGHCKSCNQN